MVREGQIYEIDIVDIGHRGEAIGKYQGFTIFVDGAVTGDKVRAKITKTKKNYGVGELLEILKPSKHRVVPRCNISGICGGCSLMSLEYKEQLRIKETIVLENLHRIGEIQAPRLKPIIGMQQPYFYRNKAQFPVGIGSDGEMEVGFYRKRSHDIIEFETCYIQHPSNDMILQTIKEFVKEHNISIYQEETKKGILRRIMTRVGFNTGEIMVVLITNGGHNPKLQKLAEILVSKESNIKSVIQNVNEKGGNVVLGEQNIVLYGKDKIEDTLHGYSFEISPHSFYQVNPEQTDVMYSKALEYAALTGNETVFDLYCGIGTISLFLSEKAKTVYGIEIVPQAIEDAKKNAKRNGVENCQFLVGKAEEIVPDLYKQGIQADVVVVDPPRKGIEEIVLQTIAEMKVPKIVYVSCNPSTMARDVKILGELEYELMECTGVDNFCHSMHVETVALLSKLDVDQHIDVKIEMDELDITAAESKATYEEIKEYILGKFKFKVSTLYIAQIKKKCGIDLRDHYNISKKENQRVPQCPQEKEEAIMDALKHFQMI